MTSLFWVAAAFVLEMPLSEIQPGQTGECLTVFSGTEIEPFPFVVRGVMPDFLGPGEDLVLARLEGDKAEFTGVVAGMSGSPCSIDGRLVGALSYAFAEFAKEPIAGITPVASMRRVWDEPLGNRPWRLAANRAGQDWDAFKMGRAPEQGKLPTAPVPIASVLSMAGVPQVVRDHFSPWLTAAGFVPVAAGGAARDGAPTALVPGGAVAAVLVSGDVDIAATGTVTTVDGDHVLAFGHPFMGAGSVSFPMATARIVNTMVSSLRSFKMAATGPIVGEVIQDRLSAIAGVVGPAPQMIPVRGVVRTKTREASFAFDVARDLSLSPRFLAIGLAAALAGRVEAGQRGTVRVSVRVEAEGVPSVQYDDVYASDRDPALLVYAAVDVAQKLSLLWTSRLGSPPKMAVSLDVSIDPEPIVDRVEDIKLDRHRVRPNGAVEVVVRLRRDRGAVTTERFLVPVPRGWAGTDVTVVAAGVAGAEKLAGRVKGDPQPTSLAQIASWLGSRRTDGSLYLMMTRKAPGVSIGVQTLSDVPPSAVASLVGGPDATRRGEAIVWEEKRATSGIVVGAAKTSFRVTSR